MVVVEVVLVSVCFAVVVNVSVCVHNLEEVEGRGFWALILKESQVTYTCVTERSVCLVF